MRFRSKYEERIWKDAKKRKKKIKFEAEKLSYTLSCNYVPDFILPNGVYVEAKGYFDSRARSKMIAVKKCNPDLDIRMLFMDSRKKLRKGSESTYADWCLRHGFPFADGDEIPESWFEK